MAGALSLTMTGELSNDILKYLQTHHGIKSKIKETGMKLSIMTEGSKFHVLAADLAYLSYQEILSTRN